MNFEDFKGLIDYLGCDFLHKHDEGLVYCTHSENLNQCEGNCNFESCPLKDIWIDAKKGLDEYDPFFREDENDL
ncbi:MAG: hypothetical protein Q8R86_06165 [Sulfuricurvum sp.]|nr:hypothetical protein [Sulfuricurvum sp.]